MSNKGIQGELVGHVNVRVVERKDKAVGFYVYWCELRRGNRKWRQKRAVVSPAGATDFQRSAHSIEAWRIARDMEAGADVAEQVAPAQATNIRIGMAADWHIAWCEGKEKGGSGVPRLSASTIDTRRRTLKDLLAHIADPAVAAACGRVTTLRQLNHSHVRSYSESIRGRKADSTHNLEIAHIAAWLAWCTNRDWTRVRWHLGRAVRLTLPAPCVTVMEDAEVRRVLDDQPTPRRRDVLTALAGTGLRIGELIELTPGNWDGEQGQLTVATHRNERTKRHGRTMLLGPVVAAALGRLVGGERLGPTQVNSWLRRQKAGGLRVTPKRFRQWFCSTLEAEGAPDRVIDYLMGHAPGQTRRHYSAGLQPSQTAPWLAKVEARLTSPAPASARSSGPAAGASA